MKITLQQNEIELAIREHIAKTLDLPEGAKVEFDDEDGITAVIDLNPNAEAKETTGGKARRPYTRRQRAEGGDEQKPQGEEPAQAAPAAQQELAQEPAQTTQQAGLSLVQDKQPESEPEGQPEDENKADGAVPPADGERKSIFGGLKRPVNN